MRPLLIRLIVALLTFTIGCAAASVWLIVDHSSLVTFDSRENIPSVTIEQKRTYTLGLVEALAFTKGGQAVALSILYSSNGLRFNRCSEYYDSAGRANKELQRTLKKATAIVKREPLVNKDGLQVGEKVIATFPYNDPYNGPASLLFTKGSTFGYITGPSLLSILQYEEDEFH